MNIHFWITLGIVVIIASILAYYTPSLGDGETYKTVSDDYQGPLVRLHCFHELGSHIVICKPNEILHYSKTYDILSIDEYENPKKDI